VRLISLFFLSVFMFAPHTFAETIKCQTQTFSAFSLVFSTSQPPTTPASLKAKLRTGFFSSSNDLSLKMAPRLDELNYTDYWNPQNFWLSLGTFHGDGDYPNSSLTLKDKNNVQTTYDLKCQLTGPIEFKNFCEETANNNPQQNLFDSVRHMNIDLLEATLPCQVNVNAVDPLGCNPLLILSDINCGTGQFDPYAAYDIKAMVSDLIHAGVSVDAYDPATQETSLIKLAHLSDLESVKSLLAAKANINAQDKDGMTALMRAVETRYLKLVQFIIDQKPNLNLRNRSGMTALEIAQAKGYTELFSALSGVNIVTIQGDSSGVCFPMSLNLKLNQPNKVVLTTKNSMLMLTSQDLNMNLMAGSGMDANTTITPQKAGEFVMNCGPQMGSGNPQGKIIVQ
jgi:hypothetical protein